jgi:hypothetical protein
MRRLPVLLPVALGALFVGGQAAAHDGPGADSGVGLSARVSGPEAGAVGATETVGGRWRGSVLLFDQSVTTQTFGVGSPYQSADPTYEWWIALKPQLTVFDRGRDALTLNLWLNAYLELTNSDTSTREHEFLLGPTYLWASYGRVLHDARGYRTSVSLGPRMTLPTDKAAFDAGEILGLGAVAGVQQAFPLAGPSARAFTDGRLGIATTYTHAFDRSTSAVDGGLHRLRDDVNGLSVLSNDLSGAMMVRDKVAVSALGDVHILPRLDLSLSYTVINRWAYSVPHTPVCVPLTGCVTPMTNADPTTFRVETWLTASVTYDVSEELALSAGYYNQANQIGSDGTRRDPLWSPSARFFLTLTANLDAVQRRFLRHSSGPAPLGRPPQGP